MTIETKTYLLVDDGTFPNNHRLPLLVYPQALNLPGRDPAAVFEDRFYAHQWERSWRNGIFDYHHYHSRAHEVLGVYRGTARVRFGGPQGVDLEVRAGDVVVIPAGVAHRRLSSSLTFAVVGAYPQGQFPDMCDGRTGERPRADDNIQATPCPAADPLCGAAGGLLAIWPQ